MRTRSLVGLLLLCIFTFAWLAPVAVAAQNAPRVEFLESRAVVDFPRAIDFRLEATTDTTVEAVQLFWRPAGSIALTLAEPDFTDGPRIEAAHRADMTVDHLPPVVDVEYFWRIIDHQGNTYESETNTLFYMDGRFEWDSFQSGLVTVWWYEGSDEFAQYIANAATRTLVVLQGQFGIQTTDPIRVVVYASDRDFASALRPNSAEWIGGVAYSALSHIVAYIRPGTNAEREIDRMIPHEISHVVAHHASANPYNAPPPWLDEGLATFVQQVGDARLGPALQNAVDDGRLIPISALKSSFPLDPDQALLSYAESVSIVAYLVETYGAAAAGDLISVYRDEVSHDAAVQEVLGLSLEELDSSWKEWLGYQGDRPLAHMGSDTSSGLPSAIWISAIIALTVATAGGFILALFWKTRTYDTTEAEETATSVPGEGA